MSKNHFLIGLGGTGGKILREFRKALFHEFRKTEIDAVSLEYLYVDADTETDLPLLEESVLRLQTSRRKMLLENADALSDARPWLGSPEERNSALLRIADTPFEGQNRRLGRLLFASHADEFKHLLQKKVRFLQEKGEVPITFHVCAGLAGGTGSGSLIDVLALIRATYPEPFIYRILVYTLLPEKEPDPHWNRGYYHANGYATLLELNALSVGKLRPHDLTGTTDRLTLSEPFNGCYIVGDENGKGVRLDVKTEMPALIADFLFRKIVAVRAVSWESLRRLGSAMSGETSAAPSLLTKSSKHSRRFFTFGIKRWTLPEEGLPPCFTYRLAEQVTFGLLRLPSSEFPEEDPGKEAMGRWLLTDDHLRLSLGISENERTDPIWQPINQTWHDLLSSFHDQETDSPGNRRSSPEEELTAVFERYYQQGYRGLGVETFYRDQENYRNEHVREIRTRIETELMDGWRQGSYALSDIRRLLETLIAGLNERREGFETKRTKSAENAALAAQALAARRKKWAPSRVLSALQGKSGDPVDFLSDNLLEQYIYRTNIIAWSFASDLLQTVIDSLHLFWAEVNVAMATIDTVARQFAELSENGWSPAYHEPAKTLIPCELRQKVTQAVRDTFFAPLDPAAHLASFNHYFPEERLKAMIEALSSENLRQEFDHLRANAPERARIPGSNIVERLKRTYADDSVGLRNTVDEWVVSSGNQAAFRLSSPTEERRKQGDGVPGENHPPLFGNLLFLPNEGTDTLFYRRLCDTFQQSVSGAFQFIPGPTVPCHVNPDEITLVNVADLFPLRYLEQTAWLKDRYDALIHGNDRIAARWDLHGEGDGSQYPCLIALEGADNY